MKIDRYGESLLILREIGVSAASFAEAIRAMKIPGVLDVVPSYDTVGLVVGEGFDLEKFENINFLFGDIQNSVEKRIIEVDICFDIGEDLQLISQQLEVDVAEIKRAISGQTFDCFAIGFTPGFPYLGYLPKSFEALGRRPTPRKKVETGSVAIAGRQIGIYPEETPGGWWIVGRTEAQLVDRASLSTLISPGDKVRFIEI